MDCLKLDDFSDVTFVSRNVPKGQEDIVKRLSGNMYNDGDRYGSIAGGVLVKTHPSKDKAFFPVLGSPRESANVLSSRMVKVLVLDVV